MPCPYARLIVGKRHCRVLISVNINSDVTIARLIVGKRHCRLLISVNINSDVTIARLIVGTRHCRLLIVRQCNACEMRMKFYWENLLRILDFRLNSSNGAP